MKRIAITGAGGFVGRALTARLHAKNYAVVALSRDPSKLEVPQGVERRAFDPNAAEPNPAAFEGADAVVHLAGESVAGRWDVQKKSAIYESRVHGTHLVVASLAAASRRPAVLISASATGYYGSRGDESLDESAEPGQDFLARVCFHWEREAKAAREIGMRSVQIRTGIVLGDGGALAQMAVPFRLGAGGPFGSGRQFVPWIHVDDLADLYVLALERDDIEGPMNGVTPDYATSARFAQALGVALLRPAIVPAPAFALRAALGEFSDTLLSSQLVIPAVAEDAGFTWSFPRLEHAMKAVFESAHSPAVLKEFTSEQLLPLPLDQVFSFFSDARNLEALTPSSLRFAIRDYPQTMKRGAQLAYDLKIHGLRVRWKTLISRWDPPHGFDDVQLHGPYALWHHRHRFEAVPGGVLMKDHVTYALPYYPLGALASPLVAADVRRIFAFRRGALLQSIAQNPQESMVAAGKANP